ncbi:hypothetical protein IEI94_12075 [Halomonas sp. ML-15]|uniref:hypothetical protein n=1 Tax=Halomonas sp. ML-15 TaxID=2773305 RepID=UPI001746D38A|nr:hypothetical protein [Halomonas sp. ML-15]MBD3896588.1 hypothetical protein [Halomonas sp. ML-15]
MGIQDREYFQRDSQRRAEKYGWDFSGKPNKNSRDNAPGPSASSKKNLNDWEKESRKAFVRKVYARPERKGFVKGMIVGLVLSSCVTFISIMIVLNLAPDLLYGPFNKVGDIINAIGLGK